MGNTSPGVTWLLCAYHSVLLLSGCELQLCLRMSSTLFKQMCEEKQFELGEDVGGSMAVGQHSHNNVMVTDVHQGSGSRVCANVWQ